MRKRYSERTHSIHREHVCIESSAGGGTRAMFASHIERTHSIHSEQILWEPEEQVEILECVCDLRLPAISQRIHSLHREHILYIENTLYGT